MYKVQLKQPDGSWQDYQHPNQKPPSRWKTIEAALYMFRGKVRNGAAKIVKVNDV